MKPALTLLTNLLLALTAEDNKKSAYHNAGVKNKTAPREVPWSEVQADIAKDRDKA
jgi:hypothetical protein